MVRINCTERYRGAAGSRLLRRELERVHASAHRTDVYEGAMLATGDSQTRLATCDPVEKTGRLLLFRSR